MLGCPWVFPSQISDQKGTAGVRGYLNGRLRSRLLLVVQYLLDLSTRRQLLNGALIDIKIAVVIDMMVQLYLLWFLRSECPFKAFRTDGMAFDWVEVPLSQDVLFDQHLVHLRFSFCLFNVWALEKSEFMECAYHFWNEFSQRSALIELTNLPEKKTGMSNGIHGVLLSVLNLK